MQRLTRPNRQGRGAIFLKAVQCGAKNRMWRALWGSSDARQAALPVARWPQHWPADARGPGAHPPGEHEAWALHRRGGGDAARGAAAIREIRN